MYIMQFAATGTQWRIETDTLLTEDLQGSIRQRVLLFEQEFSRFLPNSQLSILNTTKKLHNPSLQMQQLLQLGLQCYRLSGGLFNMSVGAELEQAGYGTAQANTKVSDNLIKDIVLEPTRISIAPHIRLDFGGFAKGWLVDNLHNMLLNAGIKNHIVNGGGDLYVNGKPQTVYIEHPTDPSLAVAELLLQNRALAVSSNNKRRWHDASGKLQKHIRNTKACNNKTELDQICVQANTCVLADAATTVLFLANPNHRKTLALKLGVSFAYVQYNILAQQPDFGAVCYS